MTEPRRWTIRIPHTGQWLTSNRTSSYRYGARDWRNNTNVACRAAKLPTDLHRVSIHAVAIWTGRNPPVRDRNNLRPTLKAIVDGLTPMRVSYRKGIPHTRGGYGLIPDDSDQYVVTEIIDLAPAQPGQPPHVALTIVEVLVSPTEQAETDLLLAIQSRRVYRNAAGVMVRETLDGRAVPVLTELQSLRSRGLVPPLEGTHFVLTDKGARALLDGLAASGGAMGGAG